MIKDLHILPPGLPVPTDDGACDHLPGMRLPSIPLLGTGGGDVDLSAYAGTLVIYFYPMLGRPDGPPLVGWNEIPGALLRRSSTRCFRPTGTRMTSSPG